MDHKKIFRGLIVSVLLLFILGFIASYDTSLPKELADYQNRLDALPFLGFHPAIALIVLLAGFLLIYSYFAMYFFVNHARYLFLGIAVLSIIIELVAPVYVETNIQLVVSGISVAVNGMILFAAFFGPARGMFINKSKS